MINKVIHAILTGVIVGLIVGLVLAVISALLPDVQIDASHYGFIAGVLAFAITLLTSYKDVR